MAKILSTRFLLIALLAILFCLLVVPIDAASSSSSEVSPREDRLRVKQKRLEAVNKKVERVTSAHESRQQHMRGTQEELRRTRRERERRELLEVARLRRRSEDDMKRKAEADNTELQRAGKEKISALMSMAARSTNRIISLDTEQFKRFVLEGTRPYWIFLSFTALQNSKCEVCVDMQRASTLVAQTHFDENVEKMHNTPVFFINVDAAINGDIFTALKLNSVPLTLLMAPRYTNKPIKLTSLLGSVPSRFRYQLQPRNHAWEVMTFIERMASVKINVKFDGITMEEYIIGALFLASTAFVVVRYYAELFKLARSPSMRWFVLIAGCVLYMWCISGGMYNIIKGNIFAHTEKDKPTQYISSEPRDQYGAEGLILGFLNLAAAGALVLSLQRAFDAAPASLVAVKGALSGGGVGSASGGITAGSAGSAALARTAPVLYQLWLIVSPYLTSNVCVPLMFYCWSQIVGIYTMKNRGYNWGIVWY